ncbi:MAG: hypothetical protein R3Y56_04755 [Akkermansia sp.]
MKQRDLPIRKKRIVPNKALEHGDWRVAVKNPEQVLRQEVPPISLWKKLHLRVEYLDGTSAAGFTNAASVQGGLQLPSDALAQVDIRGWARVIHLTIALLFLLPLSVVSTYTLLLLLYKSGPQLDSSFLLQTPVWFTLLGAAFYLVLQYSKLIHKLLVYAYVIGHESTHAIATLCCFGKIHHMKIALNGGYVETDKNNFFIALSPYFVPIWMLLWLGALSLLNWGFDIPHGEQILFAGLGFWWAFHIYWTLWILPREQPDMLENGLFFSSLLIWVMNLGILVGVLALFNLLSLRDYIQELMLSAQQIYAFFELLYALVCAL